MSLTRSLLLAALLALLPGVASAQTVLVRVLEGNGRPVFGALAYLHRADGSLFRNSLTDERGQAIFVDVETGSYTLLVEMIGLATAETELFAVGAGATVTREVRMESSAILLEGIQVEAEGGRCRVRPEEGLSVARVWDEARKALSAAAFTDGASVYRYRTLRYVRDLDRDTRAIRDERTERSSGYLRTPFESRPADDLLENGFVQATSEGDMYYAPDAQVLLSDAFLDAHCFGLETGGAEAQGLVGLSFEPVGRKRVPDIAGTLWLDPNTAELRWLDYRYQNLDADLTSPHVGGRVAFQRLPNGTWIVPEWRIRMPTVGFTRDMGGRQHPYLEAYREVGGVVTQVREPGGRTLLEAESGTIEGIVLDSLQTDPVRGARVLIVGSGQAVYTDAQGRFRIGGLTGGTYAVAFSHPSLQDLGFQPEAVRRDVRIGGVTSVRFIMPSRADMLSIVCRGEDRPEGTGVLVGWVRDEVSGITLPGAVVRVEWTGWRFPSQGTRTWARFSETGDGFETDADEGGLFRLCAVPEARVLNISASYGGFEAEVDTLTLPEFSGARVHLVDVPVEGNGSLTGLVVHEGTGAALAGVEVVLDGAARSVTTGDDGRFSFGDIPPGRYSVRIEEPGMAAHVEEVEVAPLARPELFIRIRPAG